MRIASLLLLASTASACVPTSRPGDTLMPAPKRTDAGAIKGSDLDAARELDQQGVKAFAAGRYREAIRFFQEAWRLGGPPTEIWNIARCHDRLDEPEESAKAIEQYLAIPAVGGDERIEAQRELERLKTRPSMIIAVTAPPGAAISVDGQSAGMSPMSLEVAAGAHTVVFKRDGYAPRTAHVDARFGRGVILEIELVKGSK